MHNLQDITHLSHDELRNVGTLVCGIDLESVASETKINGVTEAYASKNVFPISVPSQIGEDQVSLWYLPPEALGKIAPKAGNDAQAISLKATVYAYNDKGEAKKLKTISVSFKPIKCDRGYNTVTGQATGDVKVENFNLEGQGAKYSGYTLDITNGKFK